MQPHSLTRSNIRCHSYLKTFMRLALLGFLLINGSVWIHVRAMTHFVPHAQSLEQFAHAPLPNKLWAFITGMQLPRPENRYTPQDHYLPFEVRQITLPKNEQLEAWYVPHPQPLGVVLMFPGYAGVKEAFLTPAAHLYQFGYSSLLVDFRGSGGSSGNDTTLGLREADDVAAAFGYAQQQWPEQPIILYGISMGSAAILRAVAINNVHPAGIIVEGVFDRFLTTVERRFNVVPLLSTPVAHTLVFWGSVQTGYNGFSHNPIDYASAITSPILMLHGEQDPWIRSEEIQALAARINGPKQVVNIPDVGHTMPFVYPAPTVWTTTVQQFLSQLK